MKKVIIIVILMCSSLSFCYSSEKSEESTNETGVWIAPSISIGLLQGKGITITGFRTGVTFDSKISIYFKFDNLISRNQYAKVADEITGKKPSLNVTDFLAGVEYYFIKSTDFKYSAELNFGASNMGYTLEPTLLSNNETYIPKYNRQLFFIISPALRIGLQVNSWFKITTGLGYDIIIGKDYTEQNEVIMAQNLNKFKGIIELHFGSF